MRKRILLKPYEAHSFILTVIIFIIPCLSNAQFIAKNPINGDNPNEYNPYTEEQGTADYITFSGIGRSSGITGYNATNRYNASDWNNEEFDDDKYFYFTISPQANYHIEFISFEFTSRRSSTGPTQIEIRSSIDEYETNIGNASFTSTNETSTTISLTDDIFQNITEPVEFRMYAWGASGNTGTFSINSFSFNGYVFNTNCPVPSVATPIIGSNEINCWETGIVYTVEPINRAEEYEWELPDDAYITTGEKTNSITVNFGEESGNIIVYGKNSCGTGPPSPPFSVNVEYPVIYYHDFDMEASEHPYIEDPFIIASKLSNSIWSNSTGAWQSLVGINGAPNFTIAADNFEDPAYFLLNFDIAPGYQLKITSFNFMRRSSPTGPTDWELHINNIYAGSGTSAGSISFIGKTDVANETSSITNNVSIKMMLSGATDERGTFRLDDFTLYGMVDCIPIVADNPDDVFVCDAYILPALNSGNYFSEPMGKGQAYFENERITESQTIYIYAESNETTECFDENSFNITIYPAIRTNPIYRVEK